MRSEADEGHLQSADADADAGAKGQAAATPRRVVLFTPHLETDASQRQLALRYEDGKFEMSW